MEILSAEGFRKKLAGVVDPRQGKTNTESKEVQDECVFFLSCLPTMYSDDLDRKALWERIGSGIEVSSAKCGGDVEIFINSILQHIKAESSNVAASKHLSLFLSMLETRPDAWKKEFLSTMQKKKFVLVVHARERWNLNKEPK